MRETHAHMEDEFSGKPKHQPAFRVGQSVKTTPYGGYGRGITGAQAVITEIRPGDAILETSYRVRLGNYTAWRVESEVTAA